MKTAPPKNGTMIIAQFKSYPTPLAAVWNGAGQEWTAAVPHVEPYQGKWNDWYFENEQFAEEELESWREYEKI